MYVYIYIYTPAKSISIGIACYHSLICVVFLSKRPHDPHACSLSHLERGCPRPIPGFARRLPKELRPKSRAVS